VNKKLGGRLIIFLCWPIAKNKKIKRVENYLVQDSARELTHLVELVNAADTVVGEDEGARLQHILARLHVLGHEGGEADGRRALATRVLGARHQPVDVLQELGLGGARVAAQQDVDLGARVILLVAVLALRVVALRHLGRLLGRVRDHAGAAEQLQQDALCHERLGYLKRVKVGYYISKGSSFK